MKKNISIPISLSCEEKTELLSLARLSIIRITSGTELPKVSLEALSENLRIPAATFVTLTKKGMLRGCIGGLEANQPLVLDVIEHAAAAAIHDFRFPPVNINEVPDIKIEISILTIPRVLDYSVPGDLLTKIHAGIDGVILRSGANRATFLPQVWEKLPDIEDFLGHLCQKMGTSREYWKKNQLEVLTYQVIDFSEQI